MPQPHKVGHDEIVEKYGALAIQYFRHIASLPDEAIMDMMVGNTPKDIDGLIRPAAQMAAEANVNLHDFKHVRDIMQHPLDRITDSVGRMFSVVYDELISERLFAGKDLLELTVADVVAVVGKPIVAEKEEVTETAE